MGVKPKRREPEMTKILCFRAAKILAAVVLAVFATLAAPRSAFAENRLNLVRADGAYMPVMEYQAAGGKSCAPTIVLSHGFGGDENGLSRLAKTMAARGWRVLAMGHRESSRAHLRAAFFRGGGLAGVDAAARERDAHVARFADLAAAYSEAVRACRPPALVLAGHSMGAQTAMMEAGAVPRIGRMGSDRFDGYVALSPQGEGSAFGPGAWAAVVKPILMITGTRDDTADGGDYQSRLTAFAGLPAGRKRLAVIQGAGHLQIGGLGGGQVTMAVSALVAEFADLVSRRGWGASEVAAANVTDK